MSSYEEFKSRGLKKVNPDHSKERRKMVRRCRSRGDKRPQCRIKARRDLKVLSSEQDYKTLKVNDIVWNRNVPYGEHKFSLTKLGTLRHWEIMRTNIFCKTCGFKFCEHRTNFGASILIILWKRNFHLLSNFPKDVILLMSKMALEAHVDFCSIGSNMNLHFSHSL